MVQEKFLFFRTEGNNDSILSCKACYFIFFHLRTSLNVDVERVYKVIPVHIIMILANY
jgi:hypothetical protein